MLSYTSTLSDSFNEFNQIKEYGSKKIENDKSFEKPAPLTKLQLLKLCFNKISVEPVTFCYACALILHAPLIQQYVYQRISEDHGFVTRLGEDVSSCGVSEETLEAESHGIRKDVQSLTSYMHLGVILSASLPSLFMALLLGSWSDKVGRRIVIFLPVVGGILDSTCILITMFLRAPLYFLFIGSFMNGLCGFFTTMVLAVFSYIADITDENDRALRLGVLEAVAFTSGMLSHMTSGWWIRHLGFKAPYIFILALHLTSLLYIVFILPESKPDVDKRKLKDLFSPMHITKVFKIFHRTDKKQKWQLYGLVLTSAFMMISSIGFGSVIVLYTLDIPFCFSPIIIGYFLADCMFMQALGAIFALVILQKFLSEIMLTQLGIVSIISSLVMIAVITKKWQMFIVPIVGCFGGVCMPVIRAKMSKLVNKDEQGALFSAVATLETICTLLGAALFNSLYPYSVKHLNFKGFCFVIMASLLIIPSIILICIGLFCTNKENEEPLLSSTNQSADEDDSESQYGHSDNENCTIPQETDVKTDKQMSESSFSPVSKQEEALEISKVEKGVESK